MEAPTVPIAILGAGMYVRQNFLPALRELAKGKVTYHVVAVASRTLSAAEAVAATIAEWQAEKPQACTLEQAEATVFNDPSIKGVYIALPIAIQLDYVAACLGAGKHVLSEKPVCPIEGLGRAGAMAAYAREQGLVWHVAENYWHESTFETARTMVEKHGPVLSAGVLVELPMPTDNQYAMCEWRRHPAFRGSFLLDGGCHFAAAFRMLLPPGRLEIVSAAATHTCPHLPPPDMLTAAVRCALPKPATPTPADGSAPAAKPVSPAPPACATGYLYLRYGSENRSVVFFAQCAGAVVHVRRGEGAGYRVTLTRPDKGRNEGHDIAFDGVPRECARFFAAVAAKIAGDSVAAAATDAAGYSAEMAMEDVDLLARMLDAGGLPEEDPLAVLAARFAPR